MILAYEMVTGERPFPGNNPKELEEMHLTRGIPDPMNVVPDLPEALRRFIVKACDRNPKRRFQNMTEALKVLRSIYVPRGIPFEHFPESRRHMASLTLSYGDEQETALRREMETFRRRLESLGVKLSAADFKGSR